MNENIKYTISCDNNIYELYIHDIIKLIKNNPDNIYYKNINSKKIKINNNIVCNTQFICHRINTINELKNINSIFGIEIDLRDDHITGQLILSHDPFKNGVQFKTLLDNYSHSCIILNIKSERIEIDCLDVLKQYNITNYFFLDSSFPMIYLLNKKYNNNLIASRYSEYEPLILTETIKDMISWIWIDCFTELPLNKDNYIKIKQLNKKICIVSPELQNQKEKIEIYKKQLEDCNIIPDAICCKIYNIIEWI